VVASPWTQLTAVQYAGNDRHMNDMGFLLYNFGDWLLFNFSA
jgi:hypothetical protein